MILLICWWQLGNLEKKKRSVMARSSVENDFRAMTQGVVSCYGFKLSYLILVFGPKDSMRLHCDNKVAINIQDYRTKHVEINRHFIKDKMNSGSKCIPFVKSGEELAGVLTKSLTSRSFHFILSKLGMRDIFSPA